jgi:Fic family protein
MSATRTYEQRISSKEEQIQQLKNQRKQLVQKQRAAERKERNHRLFKRHGHLEMYMPDLALITHEQFDEFIIRAIDTTYGRGILEEIVARDGATAATKQAQLTLSDGTDKDKKPPKAGSSGT